MDYWGIRQLTVVVDKSATLLFTSEKYELNI